MIVGHRPSTLEVADKILLLQEGRVALFGQRDQVLETLKQLVSIESGSRDLEGLDKIANLIAAEPEVSTEGKITGKLRGIPTSGPGKVTHTHQWLAAQGKSLPDFDRSYFYSDSQNDIPLLSVVTHPVATNPNALLKAHAQAQGWPILTLFND